MNLEGFTNSKQTRRTMATSYCFQGVVRGYHVYYARLESDHRRRIPARNQGIKLTQSIYAVAVTVLVK